MRHRVSAVVLPLALALLAACAGNPAQSVNAPPQADAPLAHETCPHCGRAPATVPGNWDPLTDSPPIVVFPPGQFGLSRAPPEELPEAEALAKARGDRPHRILLRKLAVPDDHAYYGAFHDDGPWSGTSYAGHSDLPPGEWVYVYPHWYVFSSTGIVVMGGR